MTKNTNAANTTATRRVRDAIIAKVTGKPVTYKSIFPYEAK